MNHQNEEDPEVIFPNDKKSWSQEAKLMNSFTDQIKKIIAEGNARRVIVFKPNGEILAKTSLTVAIAVLLVLTFINSFIVAALAIVGLVFNFRVEIVNEG